MQWSSDPAEKADKPSLDLTIEIDYYGDEANKTLSRESWEAGIEQNYRLYSINVDIVRDQKLTDSDFHDCVNVPFVADSATCVEPDNGWGYREIALSGLIHGNFGKGGVPSDEYVLVAQKAGGLIPNSENQSGVNLLGLPYQGIFLKGNEDNTGFISGGELSRSPYGSKTGMVAAKTEIHEIAHSFNAGQADDTLDLSTVSRAGEVYSGSNKDDTKEPINGKDRWSIMSSSYYYHLSEPLMNGKYFVFSIEEVMTMEEVKND